MNLLSYFNTDINDFRKMSEKQLMIQKTAYEITRATLPSIIKHNYGKIVYIATGSAKYPNPPGAIAFRTAKAGIVAFAKYIAQEYRRNGIRVNIVSLGLELRGLL